MIEADLVEHSAQLPIREAAGKSGQTSTNFKAKRRKSVSMIGIDDVSPGESAPGADYRDR